VFFLFIYFCLMARPRHYEIELLPLCLVRCCYQWVSIFLQEIDKRGRWKCSSVWIWCRFTTILAYFIPSLDALVVSIRRLSDTLSYGRERKVEVSMTSMGRRPKIRVPVGFFLIRLLSSWKKSGLKCRRWHVPDGSECYFHFPIEHETVAGRLKNWK
jgi:hypothetical protein